MFTFIPAGGSGDFNVDLRDVMVALTVVLRNTEAGLIMEHFKGISASGEHLCKVLLQLTSDGRRSGSSLMVCGRGLGRLLTR